jgi:hypothetical protein
VDDEAGAGEAMGDEGADAVARMRLWEIRVSKDSSKGREYSSRKKGCRARFSEGEGERTVTVEVVLGNSWYPSASKSYQQGGRYIRFKKTMLTFSVEEG